MAHMRVLLIQLDGKLPNIALMRLSAHHKSLGDTVELRRMGNAVTVNVAEWIGRRLPSEAE